MIALPDVEAAAGRVAGRIRETPLLAVDPGPLAPAARMWLKLEQTQHTGSFKARGAFNHILAARDGGRLPAAGVVAASGGNAGLAFAYAAAEAGAPAEVFVPETAPAVKVARLRALGATVVQVGTRYAEAADAATKHAADTGALYCHAYDQPEVCAGQGTLGLEILDQTGGEVDTVLLAVGGGGLMAGVAAALEGRARVVGAEPETIPTLERALHAGRPVDVAVSGIAADSLGATRLGDIAYDVAARTGVASALVSDDAIVEARRFVWEEYRQVVEHGTAAAIAALRTGAYRPSPGERVVVVLCGANTDPSDLLSGPTD
ncbi:pyridoxal-phosphate dependent enzyme [Actinomadura sp. LD22]|uniref:Pyridoxal-phosphate dependent enzyme n=1 Tax=Actinomadura physcomitrii TaxID=2650748 RepID=A0A6I4MTH8_9ACTN|nr:threonine/serine dehydratase [Actinomadura physcomitrii]MWA07187.1 pyridoxal-phosphate dependent enzyme [Actinomadura physcomitrii]